MTEKSSATIRNSVIASLIATAIVAYVESLRAVAITFLKWLWSGVAWCWLAITDTYSLSGWVLLLLVFLSIPSIIRLVFLLIRKNEEEVDFRSYTADMMYGVKWRWSWVGDTLSNLWCYCPSCDATLVYDDSSCHQNIYFTDERKTDFICENCNNSIIASVSGGDKRYTLGAAEREILRRIRTGEYKKL